MSTRVASPILVGRREEQRLLDGLLDRAAAGEFVLATIGGEAGIGKTRLAMSASEQARRRGLRVLVGGCVDIGETTVPYAPMLEALRPLWTELDSDTRAGVVGPAAELGALIPEAGLAIAGDAVLSAGRVLELLRGLVQRLAERQPVLILIEDLHWADHATRDLLRYLARNLRGWVALIVTYRSEDLPRNYPLLREVLYEEDLLPGERRVLHTAYAAALASRTGYATPAERAGELGQLAYHWEAGGHRAEALAASVQAGLAAEAVSAPGDAERHYDRALELWDQVPQAADVSPLDRHAVLWRAAQTAHVAGDYAHAIALIGEMLAASDPDREPLQASALLSFLGYCHLAGGNIDGAEAAYSAAAAVAAPHPASPEQARALSGQSHVLALKERNRAASDTARQALASAEQAGDRPTQARALNVLGTALCNLGCFTEGFACLNRARRITTEVGDQATLLWTLGNIADALFDAGRPGESVRAAAETLPMARSMGAAASYGVYFAARGAEALAWLGQWQAARRLVDELLALDPSPGQRARPLLTSGLLRLWQGDLDTARAELTRALTGHRIIPAMATCAHARQACIDAAADRFDAALAHVHAGLDWCAETDGPGGISRLCLAGLTAEADRAETAAAARHAEHAAATPAAAALIDQARTVAAAGAASHMPVVRAELAAAEAEWSRLHDGHGGDPERWREAAEHWEGLSFPHPAGYARRRLAEALLHSRGGTGAAARELTTAWNTATMLGAGPLLRSIHDLADRARIHLPDQAAGRRTEPPANLTKREWQILTLLSDGLSNRRIAQDLFISEKTVSVHITHILAKLGVTNRTEAAAAARRIETAP